MIRFTLKCENDHAFDSWFQSSSAFEKLKSSNMILCETCGSTKIEKTLMAPTVNTDKATKLSTPSNPKEAEIAKLRKKIEENSEYVGMSFATEARKIHNGEKPERAIYGETKPEEAIKLIKEGVPVAPLPFAPRKQTN